jgi:hypothetical protein
MDQQDKEEVKDDAPDDHETDIVMSQGGNGSQDDQKEVEATTANSCGTIKGNLSDAVKLGRTLKKMVT